MTLKPFRIEIPDERLALLRDRLRTTVWADEPRSGADDWALGVPGAYLRELVTYWLDEYDWRAQEAGDEPLPARAGRGRRRDRARDPRAGFGSRADPARAHARMAVDVLGLRRGDRAARAPRALRRRPGRRVRRDRAVAPRFDLLLAGAGRHRVARDRRHLGAADARARLRAVRRPRRRFGRVRERATRARVRR